MSQSSFAETVIGVLDKLAGKQSDLELVFKDLTLEANVSKYGL